MAKKFQFPKWVKPYLKVLFPSYTEMEVLDLFTDGKTTIEVNAPRALMCVEVKGKLQALGALHECGLLIEMREKDS